MNIIDYETAGGKNLIRDFLKNLPEPERYDGYHVRHVVHKKGMHAFEDGDIEARQLRGKLWEIKFYNDNRYAFVVVAEEDSIYFLHAFKKQKNKTEKFELDTALARMKEYGL